MWDYIKSNNGYNQVEEIMACLEFFSQYSECDLIELKFPTIETSKGIKTGLSNSTQNKYVGAEKMEQFYSILLKENIFGSEKFFINRLLDHAKSYYSEETKKEYPIIMQWIACLERKDKFHIDTNPNKVKNDVLNNTMKPPKYKKSFPEYLLHENSERLASELKKKFNTEKGKGIRLMLKVLETQDPKLISIGSREMKAITESIREYFKTDIGTYSGINDSLKNITEINLKNDIKSYNEKILYILKTIDKTK